MSKKGQESSISRMQVHCAERCHKPDTTRIRNSAERAVQDVPLVDGLLILLVGLDKPLADANEAAIHEAALQQVVDGFEQQRATFVGKAVLPEPVILG